MTAAHGSRRARFGLLVCLWAAGAGLGAASAQAPAQADARMQRARQAMAAGRFAEAAPLFIAVLQDRPDEIDALSGAADALAWSGRWRDALPYLRRLLVLQPGDVRRLSQCGEMLSWSSSTRGEAREMLERALDLEPSDRRARTALAFLDAWSGHTGAALDGFDAVLAADASDAAALRGLADIRVWNGDYIVARDLAQKSLNADPANPYARLTLARADVGLGRYDEALDVLKALPAGAEYDDLDQIRGDALRGASRWVGVGFSWRDDRSGLSVSRPSATVASPVGKRGSVSAWFNPTFFSGPQGNFHSYRLGGSFDARNDSWRVHGEADAERYGTSGPTAVDGAFEAAYRGRGPATLILGFRREAVEDTLVSTKGLDIGGEFVGQVRSNLAYASIGAGSLRSHLDATVRAGGGVYTGHGLESNRRWNVSGSLGATLHGDRPYVRIGYNVEYISFEFDASAQPSAPGQRRAGGYFSPTKFLTNFAVAHVGGRFAHDRGEVFAEGSLGTQNVETTYGRFGDTGTAGTLAAGATWRPNPVNELRVEYKYLNVFNAFRRHTAAIAFRHYF
jgi:thioredoxin-like negative regulator of GroEL